MKTENPHKGHRQRLKNQFLENGIGAFEDHQVLELLLFYAMPQCDTNVYAHNLINRFGDFASVFSASYEDLKTVPGIGDNAATLIKLVPQLCVKLNADKSVGTVLNTAEKIVEFFQTQFLGVECEQIKLACFDDNLKLLDICLISSGDNGTVRFDTRKVAKELLRTNCSQVIVAHNHPRGTARPSAEDMLTTRSIVEIIKKLGVTVVEHLVVANDGVFFILEDRFFPHRIKY